MTGREKNLYVKVKIDIDENDNSLCGDCQFIVESNAGRCYYCGLFNGVIRDESKIDLDRLGDDDWEDEPFRRVDECIAAQREYVEIK